METYVSRPTENAGRGAWRRTLLYGGILSSLLYAAMMTFIRFEGYSFAGQTVSELSAIGAPSRMLWMIPGFAYMILITAFGWSVRASAGKNKALRRVGSLVIAFGLLGLIWPFAPMHMRGEPFAFTDAMHIALGGVTVVLMLSAMIMGANAFDKKFRLYSMISVLLFLAFVILTGLEAPAIAENQPTPWIGIWERINILIFLSWIAVLAIRLLWITPTRKMNPK